MLIQPGTAFLPGNPQTAIRERFLMFIPQNMCAMVIALDQCHPGWMAPLGEDHGGLQVFGDKEISFYLKNSAKPIIFESEVPDCRLSYLVMPVSPTTSG